MNETLEDTTNHVIPAENVLNGALELNLDRVVVFGTKDGLVEVFSTHPGDDIEEFVDLCLDALYAGEIGEVGEE